MDLVDVRCAAREQGDGGVAVSVVRMAPQFHGQEVAVSELVGLQRDPVDDPLVHRGADPGREPVETLE
jgi:hypothetical protein